jgi:glyoxylase-like metal-dependent hydrolase (beta-lactamase superfamily II)
MSEINRRHLVRASTASLFLLIAWLAWTQNPNAPTELKLNKVHDNLYEIEGDGGNIAVRVTNEGVILIDDKYERDHDAIVAAIRSVTSQPVKYVVSTHYHEDHSGGNAKFLPTSEIISTRNARTSILEHKQLDASPNIQPARVVFTDETSVFLGGAEVRAHYFGRGHTNGDAVIYFPDLKTVHMGDLMADTSDLRMGTSPTVDYNGGGSLLEYPKTIDKVLAAYDFDTVIPGHGPVTNKRGLAIYRDNVVKLIARAQAFVQQGKSQDELARFMQTEYRWAPGSLPQQWSVPGMMKELK